MTKKYRIDVGSIVDNETGRVYSEIQVRNLLNKYHEENKRFKEKAIESIFEHWEYAEKQEGIIFGNAPVERAKGIIVLLEDLGLNEFLKENGIVRLEDDD